MKIALLLAVLIGCCCVVLLGANYAGICVPYKRQNSPTVWHLSNEQVLDKAAKAAMERNRSYTYASLDEFKTANPQCCTIGVPSKEYAPTFWDRVYGSWRASSTVRYTANPTDLKNREQITVYPVTENCGYTWIGSPH